MVSLPPSARRRARSRATKLGDEEEGVLSPDGAEQWQLGDASDDEDEAAVPRGFGSARRGESGWAEGEGERARMMDDLDGHVPEEGHRESTSSDATLARNENEGAYTDEFDEWGPGKTSS